MERQLSARGIRECAEFQPKRGNTGKTRARLPTAILGLVGADADEEQLEVRLTQSRELEQTRRAHKSHELA
jgi:hypothetical protein